LEGYKKKAQLNTTIEKTLSPLRVRPDCARKKQDLMPKDRKTQAELEQALRGVTELHATLEQILDQSLTDRYIDANPYVKKYNRYRNELFTLLPDEDIGDILTEMQTYVYTGDEITDVSHAKQLLVEVYLKTSQLMAHLENLLELG
jgi:hypothetical protein